MYSVEDVHGPIPTVLLRDESAKSWVEICPQRGAMVLRFGAGDREVLYLDRATFEDEKANVRGGIPLLFPTPGKLDEDTWERDGKSGKLKQHGFARNLPFKVARRSVEGMASIDLELYSDDVTRAGYPWDFEFRLRYSLKGTRLSIDITVASLSPSSMPFGVGIHPYFAVADAAKKQVQIPTQASLAFDNVKKEEGPFEGFDFSREVDLHLLDHGSSSASLLIDEGKRGVEIRGSAEFTRWVIWSLPGKDFVCVEPWTSPGNALNSGIGLCELDPREAHHYSIEIEAIGL